MEAEKEKKERVFTRLKNKYRLVILNDDSFEERFSLRLTPLLMVNIIGLSIIALVALVASLIAFTPIREYIPGYTTSGMKRQLITLTLKTDSLALQLKEKTDYIQNINNIISGNIGKDSIQGLKTNVNHETIKLKAGKQDSVLRAEIEQEDRYSLSVGNEKNSSSIRSFFFFTPLKGVVSHSFNLEEEHFGVDIVAPENEAIKATLDGAVIMANWTYNMGHVIQIQHSNNLVSVYKHNSVLLKKLGERVKAGEAIAIIGNSGELSTGPHLHFELWYNSSPINPQDYMVFE